MFRAAMRAGRAAKDTPASKTSSDRPTVDGTRRRLDVSDFNQVLNVAEDAVETEA